MKNSNIENVKVVVTQKMRPAFLLLRYHIFYIGIFHFSVYWLDMESLFNVREAWDSVADRYYS